MTKHIVEFQSHSDFLEYLQEKKIDIKKESNVIKDPMLAGMKDYHIISLENDKKKPIGCCCYCENVPFGSWFWGECKLDTLTKDTPYMYWFTIFNKYRGQDYSHELFKTLLGKLKEINKNQIAFRSANETATQYWDYITKEWYVAESKQLSKDTKRYVVKF